MKKYIFNKIRVVILLLLILLTMVVAGCGGTPKLKNADFESGNGTNIQHWSQYNYRKSAEDARYTTITLVSGGDSGKCVKIESTSINDARIYQRVSVTGRRYYKVTARIRIDGQLTGGAGFTISGINTFGTSESIYTTDNEWQTVTAYLYTAKGQRTLDLSFGLGSYSKESSGTVYIDTVSIEPVKEVAEGFTAIDVAPHSASKDTGKGGDTPLMFQLLFLFLIIGLVAYVVFMVLRHDNARAEQGLSLSEPPARLNKRDYLVLAIMTVICAAASFYKLGDAKAASSHWTPATTEEWVVVTFPEEVTVSRTTFSPNVPRYSSASYVVEYVPQGAQDSDGYVTAFSFSREDVAFFEWEIKDNTFTTKQVRVRVRRIGMGLNEMAFWQKNADGTFERIPIASVDGFSEDNTNTPDKLFDEQELAQAYRTFENGTYFDEIYFPRTAYEHIHGLSIYEVTHPPLGKTLISVGISIFGMNPFGWRFMGTLMGVCLVPLMYLLALKLFKKSEYAFIASFLMMMDFMRTTQTRLATIDTYSVFFILLMYYFMYDYFSQRSYERPFWRGIVSLGLCGVCFGLGAAAKWTSIYAGVGLAVLFFIAKFSEARDVSSGRYERPEGRKSWLVGNFIPTCLLCVLFFIVIPLAIYILSYIPYMPSNPDKSLLEIMWENQKYMYNYHSNLNATHAYQSSWYMWLIDGRPIYYYSSAGAGLPEGIRASVVSMGNPAIWWVGLVCIVPALFFAWIKKEKAMIPVFLGYACQLFPWILVTRCTFIYHYFTAVPFLIFMIVYVIRCLLEDRIIKRGTVIVYLALVLILYVAFYPVMVGIPVRNDYINMLRWFSTWSF